MLARAFVGAVFLVLMGLAALEIRILWPLAGGSPEEFTLREAGQVSLGVEDRQSHLSGLAVSPSGTVWVADTTLGRVLALDRDGRLLEEFPATEPTGISADGEAVLTMDPSSQVIRRIAVGAGVTQTWDVSTFGLYVPRGVARLGDGTLVVAATGSGLVLLLGEGGQFFLLGEGGQETRRLGVSEDGEAQLLGPDYPLVDRQGRVYVSDGNVGVLRWTAEGQLDAAFRTRGRLAGVLSSPRQSALDSEGRLWVADEAAGRVWLFDVDARLIGSWQAPSVPYPVGLAIGGDRLYLTNRDTSVLYFFELPPLLPMSRPP